MKRVLGGVLLLGLGCATTPTTPGADEVPPAAFECRKRIDGKRSTGWQTLRFEPSARDATLTMSFQGDLPACSFTATWRFPQGLAGYTPLVHDGTRRCRGSYLSPFAVSCDLLAPSFENHSQSIRSASVARVSGPLSRREVVFEVLAPSAPVTPPPAAECQALPVTTQFGGIALVQALPAEVYLESECALLPAAAAP